MAFRDEDNVLDQIYEKQIWLDKYYEHFLYFIKIYEKKRAKKNVNLMEFNGLN